jgi:hypothetical protein
MTYLIFGLAVGIVVLLLDPFWNAAAAQLRTPHDPARIPWRGFVDYMFFALIVCLISFALEAL